MQYLDAVSKMTEWSLFICFQGKPFSITVIQVYAPTSNAEEAEVEWFYEDLQDLQHQKKMSFSLEGTRMQEIPEVTSKFGLGV